MIQFTTTTALTAILALVTTAPLRARAASSEFGLYAYGQRIGGFPVFNVDYLAYVGSVSSAENTTTGGAAGQSVYYSRTDRSLHFPNSTVNDTFGSLPSDGAAFSTPTTVGAQLSFSNGTSSGITSDWIMYGNVLLIHIDGAYVGLFSIVPTSTAGVWTLEWDDTDASAIPVTLKNVPPSVPPPPPSGAATETGAQ